MTNSDTTRALFLGIEGGGTRTVALMADGAGRTIMRSEFGPANLRLLSDAQLTRHFREISAGFPKPAAVAIGLAGARDEKDFARIRSTAAKAWPDVRCHATNDLETALAAAPIPKLKSQSTRSDSAHIAQILVLSGTGSCCFGRAHDGRTAKMGGWGQILGDKGSGFEIGLRALKAIVYYHDRDGTWSNLGQRILRVLQLNEPNELIGWVQHADKKEIAAIAIEVFDAWREKDSIATDILAGAACSLAKDAVSCAKKLVRPNRTTQFIFAGSVLLKQPRFARMVAVEIQSRWTDALIAPLKRESVWGAVEIAAGLVRQPILSFQPNDSISSTPPSLLSPTEERNPRSMNLDKLSIGKVVELMLDEESNVPKALLKERKKFERVVRWIAGAFRTKGRLFYVGAGTSGRLGILDASECPPTFRTPPEWVQGIIAGGQAAIWRAVEGAEDDANAGSRSIQFRGVGNRDVVVGIAASGRTPFVWGALNEAKRRGAKTVLLCFNPRLKVPRAQRPDLIIAPEIGPEVVTGSTRLKAGTATKLALNLLSTSAMVQVGKVIGNLMVDLNPSNTKLRDRAARIVATLSGATDIKARQALVAQKWNVRQAISQLAAAQKRR